MLVFLTLLNGKQNILRLLVSLMRSLSNYNEAFYSQILQDITV